MLSEILNVLLSCPSVFVFFSPWKIESLDCSVLEEKYLPKMLLREKIFLKPTSLTSDYFVFFAV